MKNRKLDNKTLDTIGRRIFENAAPDKSVVERVTSDPGLFARVNRRIAADAAATVRISFSHAVAVAGMAVVLVTAIISIGLVESDKTSNTISSINTPDALPEVARPDTPPKLLNEFGNPTSGRASYLNDIREKPAARATAVKTAYRQPQPEFEAEGEFYPLAIADGQTDVNDGHVVRVDVSRSTLFALGANVPLENDAQDVKAELLIGADGVTRGIRVIK